MNAATIKRAPISDEAKRVCLAFLDRNPYQGKTFEQWQFLVDRVYRDCPEDEVQEVERLLGF